MRRTTVHLSGAVSITARDFFGGPAGSTVGGTGLWDDNLDSTYAEIYVTCHPDAAFSDRATSVVEPTALRPMSLGNVTVLARLRAQAITATGAERPLNVEFYTSPAVRVSLAATAGVPSSSAGWHEVVMPIASQPEFDDFLARIAEGTLEVRVYMQATQEVIGFTYPGARVFEMQIAIDQASAYAPPCRNIKRGDRADLGGARNYPPSKMQQTSSRGVGAY